MRRALFVLSICLVACASACAQPAATAARPPGAGTATVESGRGARQAWYERPTTRYDHGILGDAIEGGSLVAVDEAGHRHELVLPHAFVFEDITPRIVDLDGDGENEIVTIRSSLDAGSAVVVYNIRDDALLERAATPPIGRPYRWLSIAGIGDFQGSGHRNIAIIRTPHIAGALDVLTLRANSLVSLHPPQTGYTSHYIGARFVSLAAVADLRNAGPANLIVPDQARRRLAVLNLRNGVEVVFAQKLPARVSGPVSVGAGNRIMVPLETGATFVVNASRLSRAR